MGLYDSDAGLVGLYWGLVGEEVELVRLSNSEEGLVGMVGTYWGLVGEEKGLVRL